MRKNFESLPTLFLFPLPQSASPAPGLVNLIFHQRLEITKQRSQYRIISPRLRSEKTALEAEVAALQQELLECQEKEKVFNKQYNILSG